MNVLEKLYLMLYVKLKDFGGIYLLITWNQFILNGDSRTINFSLPTIPDVVHPPLPGK